MTVEQLREMPNSEYHQWRAYLSVLAAQQEAAMEQARAR